MRRCLAVALLSLALGCTEAPSLTVTVLRSPLLDEDALAGVDTLEVRLAQPKIDTYVGHAAWHDAPSVDVDLPIFGDGATLEVAGIANGNVVAIGRAVPLAAGQKSTSIYFGRVGRFTETPTLRPTASARFGATATLLPDGRVLFVGGATRGSPAVPDPSSISSLVDVYDPFGGTWTTLPSMGFDARVQHAAVATPGGVLVAGGLGTFGPLDSIVRFAPDGSFTVLPNKLPAPRYAAGACAAGDGLLLVGGYTAPDGMGGGTLASDALLVAGDGSATSLPLPSPRAFPAVTPLADGRVLITGGVDANGPRDDALLFDPAAGTIAPLPTPTSGARAAMLSPRVGHSATLLPTGGVFIFGGNDGRASVAAPEVFDPGAGGFVAPPAVNVTERQRHAAVQLGDGSVLIVGGELSPQRNAVPAPIASLMRYAASTASTGVLDGSLGDAPIRADAGAVVLRDGSVLYAGGAVGDPRTLAGGAELYVPCFGACLAVTP